jgi:mono/diheme cytochrome c family protein
MMGKAAAVAMMVAAVLAAASWGVRAAGPQAASTNDGVYTAAQAATGQALYAQACETCHQPAKFTGAEFTRAYVGRPLAEIDGAMAEMPVDNPGSLTRDDVAALIAYFLQMNQYPVGHTPLSGEPDALKSIMIAPRP